MNGTQLAVAAVVFLLAGFALCALGVFCYFMLRMMKGLQDSAAEVTRASREMLAEAKQVVNQAKEMFGENSPIARAAKSVSSLSNNLPEVMAGLKVFNETFSVIFQKSFDPQAVRKPSSPAPSNGDESAFYAYSEEEAAQNEVAAKVKKERLFLSAEELAGMRTDRVVERPESDTPTAQS